MSWFCKFKDMFGKPNEGLHKYRFLGIAIIDFVLTIIIALLLTWLFGWRWQKFIFIFIALMVLAILLHKLFCVDTALNRDIFG